MTKLFLDDCRIPPDSSWILVKNYSEFVDYIEKNGVPDIISFDHDLGKEHYAVWEETPFAAREKALEEHYKQFEEKTGYDCAKWLVDRGTLPKEYVVHSMNPVGASNIAFVMNNAYKRAEQHTS